MRTVKLFQNVSLILVSTLLAITFIELAARLYSWDFHSSFLEKKLDLLHSAYPVMHDPLLGWIPKPGFNGTNNIWKTKVSIMETGIRSNGLPPPDTDDRTRILAVGDSFTFGDEISDHETWPAILERITKREVLNGGVFAYGIDQIFLRAEKLVAQHKPRVLIFSFIPDDIKRCELSGRSGAHKPYYSLEGERLELHNVPVPNATPQKLDWFRKLFGYSWVMHSIMKNTNQSYWYEGSWQSTKVHADGLAVSRGVLKKLVQLARKESIKVLIVVQYPKDLSKHSPSDVAFLLEGLPTQQVEVLDLYSVLGKVQNEQANHYEKMFRGHMTESGNAFVASTIGSRLSTLGW